MHCVCVCVCVCLPACVIVHMYVYVLRVSLHKYNVRMFYVFILYLVY